MKPKKTTKGGIAAPPSESWTRRGKILAATGGALVFFGLLLAARLDSSGRGRAASVCALLIVGGYVLLGVGLRDAPSPPSSPASS